MANRKANGGAVTKALEAAFNKLGLSSDKPEQ